MARPRKTEVPAVPETKVNATALEEQQNAAAERLALVVQQYGDGLPFDAMRYVDKIRSHLSRSAEEMLAAGRALVVAKEHLAYGEWGEFLDRIGLNDGVARRMVQAAVKFSNRALTRGLVEAAGNKTKLFELLVLDDDQLQELSDGGTVAGLNLDEIRQMSTSELRKALREARDEGTAADKLLEEKNTQIDRLKKDLASAKRRIKSEPPEEHIVKLRQEFAAEATMVEHTIRQALRDGIEKLRQAGMESGESDLSHDNYAASALIMIRRAVDELMTEFGLSETGGNAIPAWANQE